MLRPNPVDAVTHFVPSAMPDEGLGVLLLIRVVEKNTPQFFAPNRTVHIARAPGRLPIIGGLGHEAETMALQLPIAEAVCVAVQRRDDEFLRIWAPRTQDARPTADAGKDVAAGAVESRTDRLSVRLPDLGIPGGTIDYTEARAFLCANPLDAWVANVLGGLVVLARDHGLSLPSGFELLVTSDIPERRGAGASTALQVAALRAIAAAFELDLPDARLIEVCRSIDREIVHDASDPQAGCVAVHAESGALTALRGDAMAPEAQLTVPEGLEFVGLELGSPIAGATVSAEVAVAESARADRFAELLGQPVTPASRAELGDLLFRSHAARGPSPDRELGDFLIGFAQQRREAGALWGATLAGRGALVVLGDQTKAWYEALRLKKALRERTGHSGHIFRYSSPGSARFGTIELQPVSS
ncbi:MAG: hypothetical protein NXI31_15080 [bacterium]|nr:hypothetical protein [bacterium]